MRITINVNGTSETHEVEPRTLLVHYLRDEAGLTGTNIGCDTTSCGACTVLLDGESVKSCTVLAAQAEGTDVTTIEGLADADGRMHPVQQAFQEYHGLQCGYCTPGMVMAVTSLLTENPDPTEEDIRLGLEGNLCRCTGYHNIVAAALAASKIPELPRMIPAAFDYLRARSVAETITMLSDNGDDAKLLAGGHSLLPLMKFRLASPAVLVDIGQLRDLSYVREEGSHVAIGALTRHHDIATSPEIRAGVPVLAHVAGQVGDPQVRHRGTIGGSIAHGDSASDLPAVVLALGGSFIAQGPSGRREIAARDFHLSFFEVALEPDEILIEVRVPRAPGERWGFEKLTKRAQDWAIVGAVAVRTDDGVGVGLINMGPVPMRAAAVESAVASGAGAVEAAQLAAENTEPAADFNGSAEYRQHVARVLVRRALEQAGV